MMNHVITIAKREITSLFYSPIAYVVLALFALGSSLIFFNAFAPSMPASMQATFQGLVWLMILLLPGISMRLISDEFDSGTIELLMTSPLTDTQLVLGKWLGAMGFFLTLLIPTLVLVGVIEAFGDPDYGPLLTGYIGLLLVGGFYLAIGTFASAISRNQIISYMLTVFTICLFTFVIFLLSRASFIPLKLQQAMQFMFVNGHFEDFGKGILDLSRVVYFVSSTAFFLFLAVKLVESKRWR
ncbi:MAG: hypothetical protein CMJ19_05520 [Phycisphaeraceae bacterium]|nr:hypothetical protein [Phycisphaeraceae bacterium]